MFELNDLVCIGFSFSGFLTSILSHLILEIICYFLSCTKAHCSHLVNLFAHTPVDSVLSNYHRRWSIQLVHSWKWNHDLWLVSFFLDFIAWERIQWKQNFATSFHLGQSNNFHHKSSVFSYVSFWTWLSSVTYSKCILRACTELDPGGTIKAFALKEFIELRRQTHTWIFIM